ncbi:glycoside hydrolase family 2 TIM barrel-domain containing protein [Paludibaculum fermentans]|uniref:glycoside hydrolase family 2 TIM barrel-domain containing protein n=1 Tax=Paludibaculum fermentans TaxID=1473598 RepID=UPI003EB6E315
MRLVLVFLTVIVMAMGQSKQPRLELAADANWRFVLGDPVGAEARAFDDSSWRKVDLPHDWSIESSPAKDNPTGSGGGFYPAGTGWYRKSFRAPAEWKGRRVNVEFDGVYRDATVYLNGHKLGHQPYGYTSFRFDLTSELDYSGPNVLAVRVDNSQQPNSRWYSGSGIYRHVRVVVNHPAHVADWGVFVTTKQAGAESATVTVRTHVANESAARAGLTVETRIVDRSGKVSGTAHSAIDVAASSAAEATQEVVVARPVLWSLEAPALYRVVTRVLQGGQVVDEVETPFGIRTIAWSAEKGLLLNGKPIKLAGGSVHHDNGPLGAMAFDRAEERRVQILKAAGFNAVRTSHNPPSPAFLEACDRLGLLVFDEAFDSWKANKAKFDYGRNFDEWWQRDLSAMVLRDRNHPSVIFWSIGNEIPEVLVERGPGIAKQLAAQVRSLDSSRAVSQAFPTSTSEAFPDAVIANLDVTGYNYNLAAHHAEDHQRLPGRVMMTTESFPGAAFTEWSLVQDNPYIVGEFVWTAMDYLGESGIGSYSYGSPELAAMASKAMSGMQSMVDKMFLAMANGVDMSALMTQGAAQGGESPMSAMFPGFPWHMAQCGDIDITGYRKPQSYYRDILWNGGDRVYATVRLPEPEGKKTVVVGWAVFPTRPSWTWPGQEGKMLQVEVYSGVEKVRLYLNDKLIGEKPTGRAQEFRAMFDVPYAEGTLKAVGVRGERAVAESILTTVGRPVRLKLTAERTEVQADGQDLAYVTVEAVDEKGRLQMAADHDTRFAISGPGVLAAVGNADGRDSTPYQGTQRKLYQGRAQVIIRTSKQGGPIRLTATAPGLAEGAVTIQAKSGKMRPELQ